MEETTMSGRDLLRSLADTMGIVSRLLETHEERLNVHEAKINLLAAMVGLLDPDDAKEAAVDILKAGSVRMDIDSLSDEQKEALRTLGIELPDDAPRAKSYEMGGYL